MANLSEIFGWFSIGKTPTAQQFRDTFASFRHRAEKIEQTAIWGLNDSLNYLDENKASKDDLSSATGGLMPMGNATDMADLNTKPKRPNDSYFVLDQLDENGDPYIYRYDAELGEWINTKQTVYKDVARAGGSKKTVQELDDTINEKFVSANLLTVELQQSGSTSNNQSRFYYNRLADLANKKIYKIRLNVVTVGTFTIYVSKDIATVGHIATELKKVAFSKTGEQDVILNVQLSDNETLSFTNPQDTARFLYQGTTPIQGNLGYQRNSDDSWVVSGSNLNIAIYEFEKEIALPAVEIQTTENTSELERLVSEGYLLYSETPNNATSTNGASTGFYFVDSVQQKIRGKEFDSIIIEAMKTGLLSIVKGYNVLGDNHSYEVLKEVTFTSIGFQTVTFDNPVLLADNEWLGFHLSSDTSAFGYILDTKPIDPQKLVYKTADNVWKEGNGTLNFTILNSKVQGRVPKLETTTNKLLVDSNGYVIYTDKEAITDSATSPYLQGYYLSDSLQHKIRGGNILKIRLDVRRVGTLSILKGTDVKKGSFSAEIVQTFDLTETGIAELVLNEPLVLGDNESLGVQTASDTAAFGYINQPVSGAQTFDFINSGGVWSSSSSSLNLSVFFEGETGRVPEIERKVKSLELAIGGVSSLENLKLSIMANSISTLSGYIPAGNETFYPRGNVTDILHTWWGKLLATTGMKLEINNSWSGSRVATGGGDARTPMSDESRLSNLGNPDVIILFGGINDYGFNLPLGSVADALLNTEDRATFANAYSFTLRELKKRYPKAVLFACTPLERARYAESNTYPVKRGDGTYLYQFCDVIRDLCDIHGVNCIDLNKGVNINYFNSNQSPASVGATANLYTIDGLHPNEAGMELVMRFILNSILKVF